MQPSVEGPDRNPAFPPIRRSWIAAGGGLIALAVIFAYGNSLCGPFVFDDTASITENPTLRRLGAIGAVLSPPYAAGETVGGRPVLNLSFAINYALGGVSPYGYHVLNLAIHILAGLTLFGVLRRTLELPAMRSLVEKSGTEPMLLACASALLWAVHPLQTESVTYVAQRAESLMGLFYLLTLYCFIRYAGTGSGNREVFGAIHENLTVSATRPIWALWAIISCFLGIGTKEVMVSAPVMVFLYDRTFVSGRFREAWQRHWRLHLGLASSWLLLAWLVHSTRDRGGTIGDVSWWPYALTQGAAIVHYLRLAVWPAPLVFDYGTEWVRSPWAAALPTALVVALLVGTVAALRRRRWIGFLGAWFFAILAPTSLVPGGRQTLAEHRMYLALVPVVVLAVAGIAWAYFRGAGRARRVVVLGWGAVLVVIATVMIVLTAARNTVYASEISLWQSTVAQRPENPYAHFDLGNALALAGRDGEAIAQYEEALRIKPDYFRARENLRWLSFPSRRRQGLSEE